MIKIAAVGDIHYDAQSSGRLRAHLSELERNADVLLLAGDLTQLGEPREMRCLAEDLRFSPVPVAAVLGNHDYHSGYTHELTEILDDAGVKVLEGNSITYDIRGMRLGIAGSTGFGGGFVGACGTDFGEDQMKIFIHRTKAEANKIQKALESLETDYRVALLHYSPVRETLEGEPVEIFPFLGSYHLAEAIEAGAANICFHGHAHKGKEIGKTPGGVPVRNVAQPVIGQPFKIYRLGPNAN